MFIEECRRAIMAAERSRLPEISSAMWKAFAAGVIGEEDANELSELIASRKVIPVASAPRRSVGSHPRSPESTERRRRWVASGLMPPTIACRFTMGEGAVLAVLAAECSKRGRCTLTIGHIAALAGVGKSTVRTAVRHAASLGLLTSTEWRLSAFRSAPNEIRIISSEWLTWMRLAVRRSSPHGGGSKLVKPTPTDSQEGSDEEADNIGFRQKGPGRPADRPVTLKLVG